MLFDFDKFVRQLKEKGWKMETLYIDQGTNRYSIQHNE